MTSSDQCVLNEVHTARERWSEGAADSSVRCYGGPVAQAGIEWRLEHGSSGQRSMARMAVVMKIAARTKEVEMTNGI
jgi:hypothetical protein